MAGEGFQVADDAATGYERRMAVFMEPLADVVIAAAALGTGEAVLDVACGTGFATRRAATAVGPTGRVVGVDVNQAMLHEAARHGPASIEWVQAPAHAMRFGDDEFDAVLCQQGAQFFSDAIAAFVEMRRVLRRSGRCIASIWSPMTDNPYFLAQTEALEAACGHEQTASMWAALPPDGDRVLLRAACAAGFKQLDVRTIEIIAHLPDLVDYVPAQFAATPWGELLLALDPAARSRVVDDVILRLGDRVAADGTADVAFSSYLLVATS